MADIAMCLRKECIKSKECYRFNAVPDKHQSYGAFLNCNSSTDFTDFWAIGEDRPENPKCEIDGKCI